MTVPKHFKEVTTGPTAFTVEFSNILANPECIPILFSFFKFLLFIYVKFHSHLLNLYQKMIFVTHFCLCNTILQLKVY